MCVCVVGGKKKSFAHIQIDCNNVFAQFITPLYHLFQRVHVRDGAVKSTGEKYELEEKVNHTVVSHARLSICTTLCGAAVTLCHTERKNECYFSQFLLSYLRNVHFQCRLFVTGTISIKSNKSKHQYLCYCRTV